MINIRPNYTIFRDFDGTPLENGYVYVGEENRNPIEYPVNVYFDQNYLNSGTQPIRTILGNPSNGGNPSALYVSEYPFSLLILNEKQEKIHYNPSAYNLHPALANKNILVDGDFQLFETWYQDNIHGWIIDYDNIGYQYIQKNQEIGSEFKKYLTFVASSGIAPDSATDYIKICQTLEDIYSYSGKYLTLSFYANSTSIEFFKEISTSITVQYTTGDTVPAIGVKKHTLSLDWIKYEYTFKMPFISNSLGLSPYPADTETALLLNIWIAAGTDYNGETDFLANMPASSIYTLNIANIKLELSEQSTDFIHLPIENEYLKFNRKFESSLEYNGKPISGNQAGYIEYISPGIQSFIPGFRFRQKKRTTSPTIRIYSYTTKDEGKVTLVGTGDINVTSVDDIGINGCGAITLASNTAAGNVYKYHYIVEDEFTL